MTESIDTAPKDGTKILCICSDGKTRYCWWFGCNDVDGSWMTEEVAEPVAWYTAKRLPARLKEQALKAATEMADCMKAGFVPKRSDLDAIRRALESLPS